MMGSRPPNWGLILYWLEVLARGMSGEADSCECHGDTERVQHDPTYRRALWIVVALNVGFGLFEIVGGFLAQSQALKADALDFLGDGSITFVGRRALPWTERARARVALIQGVFLAGLGISVIGLAGWRTFNAIPPEAELMGGIGIAALAVNVVAAWILSQFKEGDSNVRAVWLFSRNDALANVAVIVAAGLFLWTQSAWPDLVVAAIIALHFLHSASEIIRGADRELNEPANES